jgi:hypothetical protein
MIARRSLIPVRARTKKAIRKMRGKLFLHRNYRGRRCKKPAKGPLGSSKTRGFKVVVRLSLARRSLALMVFVFY